MDIKNLSSCQVWWVQELCRYHFWIDYCQSKANGATDALFCFLQRNKDEKEKFPAENTQIFHFLQFSLINASLIGLSLSAFLNFSNL